MEGEPHRWMRQIGHDGRLFKSASDPVEEPSMAQRLCSEERARVEAMTAAGVGVKGRRPGAWAGTASISTVWTVGFIPFRFISGRLSNDMVSLV